MQPPRLLRFALRANAAFSATSGSLALWLKNDVATSLALPPLAVTGGAWLLVVYGLMLGAYSTRPQLLTGSTRVVIGLDVAWVVGSCLLVTFHAVQSLTLVVLTGSIVLSLAALQAWGLAKASGP